jgi:hypothetical protein
MREWQKPTINETESGMEVDELPAGRAGSRLIRLPISEDESGDPAHGRVAALIL